MKIIKYSELLLFTKKVLKKAGLDKYSTNAVATGLCETSLRGVESHGIRLLNHYIQSALFGRKNPKPNFKFYKSFSSLATLDADNAFGHAAGFKAIEYSMKVAKKNGISVVSVRNSSHPGALASMSLKAARKGFLSLAFTHADALMLSHNGKRAYFGTNPICFAVPRIEKEPYCLDMATSMISWNKLLIHKAKKKKLEDFFAATKDGYPTRDPDKSNALIGAGSYKGYGLASLVEILCGVYSGMNFGRSIPPMYTSSIKKPRKLGQFYITMRVDGSLSKSNFLKQMQKMCDEVRKEPKKKNTKVKLPNDNEIDIMKKNKKEGIKLSKEITKQLVNISKNFSIKINFLK
jgi:ureidoglycolate dehydrogenase (NAD+)